MIEEIYICCGEATNHCKCYDGDKFLGKHLLEIDNAICSDLSDEQVTELAKDICKLINEKYLKG